MARRKKKNLKANSLTARTPQKRAQSLKACAGFELSKGLPYLQKDLIEEPTQKRIQSSGTDYVSFLTSDNYLLDQLFSAITNSPTLGAVIAKKTTYTLAGGFHAVQANNSILKNLAATAGEVPVAAAKNLDNWLKAVGSDGSNFIELSEKIIKSLWSFGNAFVELQKFEVGGKKKFYLDLLPVYICRPKYEKGQRWTDTIGVSEEFEEDQSRPAKVADYPKFPEFKEIKGRQRSIIHLKMPSPNFHYWGAPDWIGARKWAEIEYRLAESNVSKFENGFMPSAVLTVKSDMSQSDAVKLVNNFQKAFTGTGNSSKMFIQVLQDTEAAADVQILDSQKDGDFMSLAGLARQNIIVGSGWTSSLAGIETAGKLGSNQQIQSEFDIIYNSTILPFRELFLGALNPVIETAGDWLGNWANIELKMTKPNPLSLASWLNPAQVMTEEEQRAALGLAPKK